MQYKEKWEKLLTPYRVKYENDKINIVTDIMNKARSPFNKDYDRIIFSDSFRRLTGKTQVHPLSSNDHVHTRLAHSLEVASVGRGLGTSYGYFLQEQGDLPDFIEPYHIGEIVQSACLAHDIGNPPFGHAGEFAIQEWFRAEENKEYVAVLGDKKLDFQHFDGNAQGFRVINVLENDRGMGGFKLSFPTIASVVKYPYSSSHSAVQKKSKFNYFHSEKEIFAQVFALQGLQSEEFGFLRHPLSYLMESADDICYRIIDMEDARELGILSISAIKDVLEPIWDSMAISEARLNAMYSDRERLSYIRSQAIFTLTEDIIRVSKEQYNTLMQGKALPAYMDLASDTVKAYMKNAKDCFNNVILKDTKKTSLEIGSYTVYKCLLDAFIPAMYNFVNASDKEKINYRDSRLLTLMGVHRPQNTADHYVAYQAVIDFVTGMTDKYATFIASQFAGNGVR